ncbi:MAG TPA: 3-methyl-2-oxobutanoate hydroxymethyltransferase [Gemmatimonadaceae bacterium]|nr:3-methyl-2-oxobutanoate hydroxymethyltransferase [Gemmatimonadaceae bacterium]
MSSHSVTATSGTTRPEGSAERIARIGALRRAHQPIVMVTAYDVAGGRACEAAGVDIVLVGDSGANVVLGYGTTREVSLDEMLMLTRAVRRGVQASLLVGDLPFGTYEHSDAEAVATARRFVEEAGCDGVKLEGAGEMLSRVQAVVAAGIPVMGHVGLLPQSARDASELRAKGRKAADAARIIADAVALERAGCFSIVIEAVPAPVSQLLTERVTIPTIGIGAGAAVDGQVLVYHDILGIGEGPAPKFVKRYSDVGARMVAGLKAFADEVRSGAYPQPEHTYGMPDEELEALRGMLPDS